MKTYQKVATEIMKSTRKALTEGERQHKILRDTCKAQCIFCICDSQAFNKRSTGWQWKITGLDYIVSAAAVIKYIMITALTGGPSAPEGPGSPGRPSGP